MHDSFQQLQLTQPSVHMSIQPLELISHLKHSGYYMNHPVHKNPQLVPIFFLLALQPIVGLYFVAL